MQTEQSVIYFKIKDGNIQAEHTDTHNTDKVLLENDFCVTLFLISKKSLTHQCYHRVCIFERYVLSSETHICCFFFFFEILNFSSGFPSEERKVHRIIHYVTREINIFSLPVTTRSKQEKLLHNSFFSPGN